MPARQEHAQYAYDEMKTDGAFREGCTLAKVEPSRRQWRKWCNGTGAARKALADKDKP